MVGLANPVPDSSSGKFCMALIIVAVVTNAESKRPRKLF